MGVSKTGKTYADRYKTDVSVNNATNGGFDSHTRALCSGDGADSSISLSDDVLQVQPQNDDTAGTMLVYTKSGSLVFAVDTTNSRVFTGASQVSATTLFKEMGLYAFSPNAAGNHYPLIANRVGMQGAEALTFDDDWGNGADPPTTIDVSGLSDPENAIAIYWYLENNITLDSIRYMCRSEGSSETLNFHLFSYDLDVSSYHGDLSGGVVCASASEAAADSTKIRTGTFTLDSADINANKVVVGFCEPSSSTDDFTVNFNIKYHIR